MVRGCWQFLLKVPSEISLLDILIIVNILNTIDPKFLKYLIENQEKFSKAEILCIAP